MKWKRDTVTTVATYQSLLLVLHVPVRYLTSTAYTCNAFFIHFVTVLLVTGLVLILLKALNVLFQCVWLPWLLKHIFQSNIYSSSSNILISDRCKQADVLFKHHVPPGRTVVRLSQAILSFRRQRNVCVTSGLWLKKVGKNGSDDNGLHL